MDEQCYELICGAGLEPLLQGGRGRASGFIMRMMAENKLKHTGQYKKPTAPLSAKSTMNKPIPFDYNKLANGVQKGTNKNPYGASPFIQKYFKDGTVAFTKGNTAQETDAQKKARLGFQNPLAPKPATRGNPKKPAKARSAPEPMMPTQPTPELTLSKKEESAPVPPILSKEVLDNRVFATFGAYWEEWVKGNLKNIKEAGYSRERQYDILHTEALQGHGALFGNLLSGPTGYMGHFTSLIGKGAKDLYRDFLKTFLGYKDSELREWRFDELYRTDNAPNKGRTDTFWWYKDMSKAGDAVYDDKIADAVKRMNIFGQSLVMRIAGLLVAGGDTIAITPNVEYQSYDEKTRKYTKKLGDRLLIISGDMANDITGIFTNNYRGVNGYSLPQDKQVFLKGDKWVFDDDKYKSDNNIARRDKGWVEMYRKAVDEYKGDVSLTDTWVELEPTDGGDRDVYRILEEFAIEEKKPKAKATKRK